MLRRSLVVSLICACCRSAAAAPPAVSSLFPPSVQRGQSVKVAVGEIKPWPVTAWTDDPGLTVEPDPKPGHVTIKAIAAVEPGVHWLRFLNADGASLPQVFIVGTLPEVLEQEPNETLTKSQPLPSTQIVVVGKLDPAGDLDTFTIPLQAGERVVIDVQAHRPLASPMDAVLQLVDAQGFVVAQDHDFVGLDPRITFTAPAAGTYHARLFGFPEVAKTAIGMGGGERFIYRLTISTAGFVDYAWPMTIPRSGESILQLCGANIPEPWQRLPVKVTHPRGTQRVFHERLAGATTVRVVDQAVLGEQEPNDRDHAQPITLPAIIVGRCELPGDEDVFSFEGVKKKLVAKVESRSLGFVMDPFLTLFDAGGKVLKSLDDSKEQRDCELTDFIRTTDRYRVAIRDLYGNGSPRHAYQLTIQYESPSFELTAGGTEYVIAASKALEIPVTIERRGEYAQPITFEVRGLPESFKIDAPQALLKGETAKSVKLKITGDKPWSGPIEIVGIGAHEPPLQRTAGVILPNTGERWTQIWLTVTK